MGRLLEFLQRDRLSSEIRLKPLAEADVEVMLAAMGADELSPTERLRMHQLAEGIPFYIEELASSPRTRTEAVPSSIANSVSNRLQGLPTDSQAILVYAAILTGRIERDLLAAAVKQDRSGIDQAIAYGVAAGLLSEDDSGVGFRHALVREAVLGFRAGVDLGAARSAVVDAIESQGEPDARVRYSRELARLLGEGGDLKRAARYWLIAGEEALALGALEDAQDCFESASGAGEFMPQALLGMAEVSRRRGEIEDAARLLRAAWREERPGLVRAGLELAEVLSAARDPEALDVLAAVEAGGGLTEGELCRASFLKGRTAQRLGLEPATASLEFALSEARRLGDRKIEAETLATVALNHASGGKHDEALALGEAAARTAVADGSPQLIGATHVGQATNLGHLGRGAEALVWLDEARRHLVAGLSSYLVASVDNVTAWVYWRMGEPTEADRFASRVALRNLPQGYGRMIQIWAAAEQNDLAAARAHLRSWWEEIGPDKRLLGIDQLLELPDSSVGLAYAMLADVMLAAYFGESIDGDQAALAKTYANLCGFGPPDTEAFSLFLMGLCQLLASDVVGARETSESVQAIATKHQLRLQGAFACELRARVAYAEGRAGDAARLASEGIDKHAALNNKSDSARLGLFLGSLLDGAHGIDVLRRAFEEGREVGAVRTANRAEAALRERGVRVRAGRRTRRDASRSDLTGREEEVASLVATGATNGEIAARLFISERTVQDHLSNAARKAGASGRAGLAAWAAKQGLV